MPRRMFSSVRASRCARSSLSSSASSLRPRKMPRRRDTKMRSDSISGSFGASEQAGHERGHALPAFGLGQKLFSTAARERVELGFSIVVGDAPLRGDPAALLEAQQRRVKRALVEFEQVGGNLLNAHGNAVTVQGAEGLEGLEDDQIEGPLKDFPARLRHRDSPLDGLQEATLAPVDCQQDAFPYRRSGGGSVS